MARLRVAVPALSPTLEIGGIGTMDIKPTLSESLLGYQLLPYPGGILGAALGRPDRFVGRLAEAWTVSADGRTIEMLLREVVRSVAGNELTAEDVRYTLERGFHVPGYYRWTAEVAGLRSPEDVVVLDRRRVRFRLATPSEFFLDTRAFPMNGIFDSRLLRQEATADDPWAERFVAAHPAGFGPYTVEEVRPGERMTFRARADYYRGQPAFHQVVYQVVADASERERLLARGAVDHALGLAIPQLLRLRELAHLQVVFGPSTSVFGLALQCRGTPLANVHLRRAIASAVPYQTILQDVFHGVARPWRGYLPPIVAGYDERLWPYREDPVRARMELDAAGPPTSWQLEILCNAGLPTHRPTAERLVGALAAIGLPATVCELPAEAYFARRAARNYQAALVDAGPMVADAGYQLAHDYCSDSEGNDFGYANPQVDALVREGLTTAHPARRAACYATAQRLLAEDVPLVPLAAPGFALAVHRRVRGIAWYPR
ncbi:MAG: peptide ABC transporter substrate-binding protein [Dehalococcoidia bacterium]|nr:MAG: peptide ABC transporter substrate-binding protein [Dehalococcoidia bacterium]